MTDRTTDSSILESNSPPSTAALGYFIQLQVVQMTLSLLHTIQFEYDCNQLYYYYGKSWRKGNASRSKTNEILTVYLVKGSALYTGDTDQDDL